MDTSLIIQLRCSQPVDNIIIINRDGLVKAIAGYRGLYRIYKDGKIESVERAVKNSNTSTFIKKSLYRKQVVSSHGYKVVTLAKNGKVKQFLVHRLVAEAFIPNPDNKPEVNHIDGDKLNNKVENLEWVNHSENMLHAHTTGLIKATTKWKEGAIHPSSVEVFRYSKEGKFIDSFGSALIASRATGLDNSSISKAANGKLKLVGGFIWKLFGPEEVFGRDNNVTSNHWKTPKYVYDPLDKLFKFDFDPCPYKSTFDGLKIPWGRVNWVNPSYDKINKPLFIKRCFEEWKKGNTSVLLIPNATETDDFYKYIYGTASVYLVKKRIRYVGTNTKGEWVENKTGKSGSMLCVFNPGVVSKAIGCIEFDRNKHTLKFI